MENKIAIGNSKGIMRLGSRIQKKGKSQPWDLSPLTIKITLALLTDAQESIKRGSGKTGIEVC